MKQLVAYIERSKCTIYTGAAPVSFSFGPTAIRDLEVADPVELAKEITASIDANKLEVSNLIFILADDLCFEKNIPSPDAITQQTEAQTFLESLPFEHTAQTVFTLEKGIKLIGTNLELYEAVAAAFGARGFDAIAVFPSYVLHMAKIDTKKTPFNQIAADYISKNEGELRRYSFLPHKEALSAEEERSQDPPKKVQKNKTLIILLPIMTLLFVILGFMVYQNFFAPPQSAVTQMVTVPLSSVPVASPSATLINKAIPVKVTGAADQQSQLDTIKSGLTTAGFITVTTSSSTTASLPQTLVLFPQNTPEDARRVILEVLRKLYPNFVVQDATTASSSEIVVTLEKAP